MKPVTLEVLYSPGCQVCRAFDEFWNGIAGEWPGVTHRAIDVTTPEGQALVQKHAVFSSPAIILNGELFEAGGFDRGKFIGRLKELSTRP